MANRKLGKVRNLRNLGKLFQVFLFPSFRFFPTAKIENLDLKILEKNFQDFRGFRVFDLAVGILNFCHGKFLHMGKELSNFFIKMTV